MASSEADSHLSLVLTPALEKIIKNASWRKHSKLAHECKSVIDRLSSSSTDVKSPSTPQYPNESELNTANLPGPLHDGGPIEFSLSESESILSPLITASSWPTLPNRSLLCRPLPQDIGRCTCVIVKETTPLEGFSGGSFYALYTNEGQGRQDRKLAIAHHRRRNGKTEFIIAQNAKGLLCRSDDSFLGSVNANFMGSKYQIWDKGNPLDSLKQ